MKKIINLIILAFLAVGLLSWSAQRGYAWTLTASDVWLHTDQALDVIDLTFAAEPRLLQRSQQVSIRVILEPKPNVECYGIPREPIDTFLIVDNSSHDKDGIQDWKGLQAIAREFVAHAAQEITNGNHRQNSRFSVISAQTDSVDAQFVSADQASSILATLSESSTELDLASAIRAAASLYQISPRQSQPVLVILTNQEDLLTDAAKTALADARSVMQADSDHGIEVVFIAEAALSKETITALDIDNFSPGARLLLSPSVPDLRKLFIALSHGQTEWLAQNISVVAVTMPTDAFQAIHVQKNAAVVEGGIVWKEDHLLPGQHPMLNYQVAINPDLSTDIKTIIVNTSLTYIDCNGVQNIELSSFPLELSGQTAPSAPSGVNGGAEPGESGSAAGPVNTEPSIAPPASPLIDWTALLPLLKWAGVLLLILLLLYLLWKYLHRKNVVVEPKPYMPKEVLDPIPAWFKRLLPGKTDDGSQSKKQELEFQETILIGLGTAGRTVLSQLVLDLNARFGDEWRSKIHVLQIDVDVQKTSAKTDWHIPAGLKEGEWILLRPELQEIKERLQRRPRDWEYLKWFEKTAPAYPRSQGRIALFWDLRDGPRTSQFWRAVEGSYQGLSKTVIRVVGATFDDIGSGILVDVAYLVKRGIVQRDADVELWLLGPASSDWIETPGEIRITRNEQAVRTLATLRELERFQRNAKVHFKYVPLASTYTQLNQIYEYAVTPTVFLFDPSAKGMSHQESMRKMSGALSSLMYRQTAGVLSEHISHNRLGASGKSVVCGLGHHDLRITSGLVEKVLAWRMVKDVLLEERVGIFPIEESTRDGKYQSLDAFISQPALQIHREQDEIKKWIAYAIQSRSLHEFCNNVSARLGQILNGEPGTAQNAIKDRRMALDKAERWLKILDGTVRMYPELPISAKVKNLQTRLDQVRDWIRGEVAGLAKQRWQNSRTQLERLSSGSETDLSADLEWTPYKEIILLSDAQAEKHFDQSPLFKLASRFGWYVRYDEEQKEWSIHLVIPPFGFGWQESSRPDYYLAPGSAVEFLDGLFGIGIALARLGLGRSAVERASLADVSGWTGRADAMLQYDDLEASRLVGSVDHLYVLGVSESFAPQATRDLAKKFQHIPLQIVDTQDRSVVHLIHEVDWIPFETLSLYDNEQWERNTVLPAHYVWPLEQWAAEVEMTASERLSVSFLNRYNEQEEFMTTFGLGLIYDLFNFDEEGCWTVPFPGQDGWKRVSPERHPERASSLLAMFFDQGEFASERKGCITLWKKQIQERRQMGNDTAYEFFRDLQRKKIPAYFALDEDDAQGQRDLGVFLTHLIEVEKKTPRS